MKTTLEIPDGLFREAKAAAARKGQPLRELVTEAIRAKLAEDKALDETFRGAGENRADTSRNRPDSTFD
jgi:hypothetical protein